MRQRATPRATTETSITGLVAGATFSTGTGGYMIGVMVLDGKGRWTGEELVLFVDVTTWEKANGGKPLPQKFNITYTAGTGPAGSNGTASSIK